MSWTKRWAMAEEDDEEGIFNKSICQIHLSDKPRKVWPRLIKRPNEPKPPRKQKELGTLRKEKKVLRCRWKEADEGERYGLLVLWSDVKRRVSDFHQAEKAGIKKNERRQAR